MLRGSIRSFGVYETTIDQEKHRRKSVQLAATQSSDFLAAAETVKSNETPGRKRRMSTAWADGEHRLAEAAAYRFKHAYANFGVMSKHVNDFSKAWSFYFFFAEFFLVFTVAFAGVHSVVVLHPDQPGIWL